MLKITLALILAVLAIGIADARVQLHRGLTAANDQAGHPYLFLTVPRGRGGAFVQGFEVMEDEVDDKVANAADNDDDDEAENDDDDEPIVGIVHNGDISRAAINDADIEDDDEIANDDDNDNDDDEETENESDDSNDVGNMVQVVGPKKPATIATTNPMSMNMASNLQMILQNAKPTQMMVSKEHAGAIMVPDGIIEIEGQRVVDEKTGKAHLLVPREALDAIPDGSVVAVMERSAGDLSDDEEEERANRVIVRRRRRGSRRNVRRRGGNNRNRRRRVNYNNSNKNRNTRRRRVNNRRKNVRVIRTGGGNNNNNRNRRRRNNNRRRVNNRPMVIQG